MNPKRKKHHIYTIVLGRNKKAGCARTRSADTNSSTSRRANKIQHNFPCSKKAFVSVAALAVIAGIICARYADNTPSKKSADFMLRQSTTVLNISPEANKSDTGGIYAGSLLSLCSPVFTEKGDIIPVFNQINADNPSSDFTEKESALPYVTSSAEPAEKTIISENLKIINATDYPVTPSELIKKEVSYSARGSEPKVLIMHTHGCETYSSPDGTGLGENGTFRTTDTEKNVVKLGELLTAKLRNSGIAAIHDKTLCDTPSYNKSYINSMALIENYKKKYPSISFVFDIHRDALATDDGTAVKLVYSGAKEKTAQAMIVCGTDSMGLHHPNWRDNLILALKIQQTLEQKYPGYMRPVNLRRERFNMHETGGSLIFEIGGHGNTLEEAKRSIDYLADGIIEVIGKA